MIFLMSRRGSACRHANLRGHRILAKQREGSLFAANILDRLRGFTLVVGGGCEML